jgi:hypothetical protein
MSSYKFHIVVFVLAYFASNASCLKCGLVPPDVPEDCYKFNNEIYSCCYVEVNPLDTNNPKLCYGVLNYDDTKLPTAFGQYTVKTINCATPKPAEIIKSHWCGNNITSTGPLGCYMAANNNTNCCELLYDNFATCVDSTMMDLAIKNKWSPYINCAGDYFILPVLLLISLYILIVN